MRSFITMSAMNEEGEKYKMEYVIVIILIIATIILLKIGLDIKIKDVKNIKNLGYDKNANEILRSFPENAEICKEILNMLDNKDVKIEEVQDEKNTTSIYMVMQNKIIIGNVKDSFTRIQTIAHECIHSIQNKTLLKFNFIISNLSIIYFLTICILALFNVISSKVSNILLIALILMQSISFIVRNFLEVDAMTRAEFLANEYIDQTKLLNEEDARTIKNRYKEMNKTGIKLYTFTLACKSAIKAMVYCIFLL